jgi:hypothetical protein
MNVMQRHSPVSFKLKPIQTETRNHWSVALEYPHEGEGPHLVDLSHKQKWDIQSSAIDTVQPFGVDIPKTPGRCTLAQGIVACRMNGTQARVFILGQEENNHKNSFEFTDITESHLLIALAGPNLFSITEKLTSMDLQDPKKPPPYLFQGPFAHVPCQVAVVKRKTAHSFLLLSCSRGYAKDMVDAVLAAGKEFGLKPAGETAFNLHLAHLDKK